MNRHTRKWLIAGTVCIATSVVAQEQLPKNLEGNWNGYANAKSSRPNPIGGALSVVIEKQNPDGTIEGKMTYSGAQFCELKDDPMTGKFDGTVLTLQVTFRNKMPNAGCGPSRFVMNKDADGTFAGEIPNSPSRIRAKLAPR
jgi:hypothetical protein